MRAGAPWRMLPHDGPPWAIVHQQTMRWLAAEVFEAIAHDLRVLLRGFAGRAAQPSAASLDSRTLHSTPESGHRAGYDGAKRRKGSKLHLAVDTLGHLLAAHTSPPPTPGPGAGRTPRRRRPGGDRRGRVEIAYVDQGYSGGVPAAAAAAHGVRLVAVKHPGAKRGFVLLPRRWLLFDRVLECAPEGGRDQAAGLTVCRAW